MIGLEAFVENLIKTGLVSSREIAEARASIDVATDPQSAVRLAQNLIDRGLLTSYQARKILAGATRGFILDGYRLLRPLGRGRGRRHRHRQTHAGRRHGDGRFLLASGSIHRAQLLIELRF